MPRTVIPVCKRLCAGHASRKRLIEKGVVLISKPMSPKELLKKVREILDI